ANHCPEGEFELAVEQMAFAYGWIWYHTHRAQFSPAGFPDLVLVRPPRIVYAELKGYDSRSRRGQPTADQQEWIELLLASGQDAGCYWPEDWGLLEEKLR
ncbi:MAG TPA: hypothetical protein VFW75_05965, partial [Acetobacteraceae bacterium]|nr:hypothetical protein [Acetobacteraceae bacterium]